MVHPLRDRSTRAATTTSRRRINGIGAGTAIGSRAATAAADRANARSNAELSAPSFGSMMRAGLTKQARKVRQYWAQCRLFDWHIRLEFSLAR